MFSVYSLLLLGLVCLWIGAGLIVSATEKLAHRLRLSSFLVSFFLLGFATSVPEIAVGVTALIENQPEIFVGNYVGGAITILLLIVPTLAILGNGIEMKNHLSHRSLLASLVVISLPVAVTINGQVTLLDALLCILAYTGLYFVVDKNKRLREFVSLGHIFSNANVKLELLRIVLGIGLVFVAGEVVVHGIMTLAEQSRYPTYLISMLLLSLGTNLPEFSIAIRSSFKGQTAIGLGNYLGSASFHTFLLGLMSLAHSQTIVIESLALLGLGIFFAGLILFYYFGRTQDTLSRHEALVLLGLYFLIVASQLVLSRA